MIAVPDSHGRRARIVLSGLILLLAACHGGENKPILKPMVKACLIQDPPPQADGVVFFDNVIANGDSLSMRIVVRDSTGLLDIDDVDVVLRYDASFIQVVSVGGQSTLFGTCNTVNPVCGVNSPICLADRVSANIGGQGFFCRSNGSSPCTTNADCTMAEDACGNFGILRASFAVLTGPKVCSNNPALSRASASDCQLCVNNSSRACTSPGDCGTCSNNSSQACTMDSECTPGTCVSSLCGTGTCPGCPSVVVSGTQVIATLALRVMKDGSGSLRFVVSPVPGSNASAVRKNLGDQNVLFFPNVDATDPSVRQGSILVAGDTDGGHCP